MNENIQKIIKNTLRDIAGKGKGQSFAASYFLHEMEPLLQITHEKPIDEGTIKVGFSTYGNKHLFSDTFGRSRVLLKEDLKDLGRSLKTAPILMILL